MAARYFGPGKQASPIHANLMHYYKTPQPYGAAAYAELGEGKPAPAPTPARSGRRRLNPLAALAGVLVPWMIFATVFGVMAFSVHYSSEQLCYLVLLAAFVVVLLFGFSAVNAFRRRGQGQDPVWHFFLFNTGLLGWMLGSICGHEIYSRNMRPFYDMNRLNEYADIDPTATRGQQLMDAGKIRFAPGAQLDFLHSMTFKDLQSYCVAPLTRVDANGTARRTASYDFWAVGLNCCDEWNGFRCGEFNNPRARAGLRLMREDLKPMYRLAVQQAEAAYNIRARHPVLLHWVEDPDAEAKAYAEDGARYFSMGLLCFFGFQLFAVLAVIITMFTD
mmetsp:Transcript_98869/g.308068  ORF Transcript_98869/g.308068 Transcript_98869/m.308068 type:complete len:333 (+) Transcript_98869:60-1058(+)